MVFPIRDGDIKEIDEMTRPEQEQRLKDMQDFDRAMIKMHGYQYDDHKHLIFYLEGVLRDAKK